MEAKYNELLKEKKASDEASAKVIQEKEKLEKDLQDQKDKLEAQAKQLEEMGKTLKEVKEAKAKSDKEAKFQERMAELDEEFDLSDSKISATITRQLQKIESDEDFKTWKDDFVVTSSHLKKDNKKEKEDNEVKASKDLETIDKKVSSGSPNSVEVEKSEDFDELIASVQKAFSLTDKDGPKIRNRY